jgi:hypothetical protein
MGILGMARKRQEPIRSALDVIHDAEYPLIPACWKGTPVLVRVRELSQVQLMACGNFSMINLGELGEGPFVWKKWTAYAEQNYRILKACLVAPSYEEVFELVGKGAAVKEAEARFRELDDLIGQLPRGPMRQGFERERDTTRCMFDLMLPEDFIGPIVSYAVGVHKSDIKKITRDMLLDAAVLAERGHDNPSDHIEGVFTAFNRDDINRRAWAVLVEEQEARARKVKHGR